MTIFTRPVLEIKLDNLVDNYRLLCQIAPNTQSGVVVKNNAYGLDDVLVTKTLYEYGHCRCFFVAHGFEGKKIRNVAPSAKIFVLQGVGQDCIADCVSAQLIPVINSPTMFEFWKKHRIHGVKPAIQIETGLNRLGFRETDLSKMSTDDLNEFETVLSHLACADEKDHFMNKHQLETFVRLKETYFHEKQATLSASDGTFLGSDYHFDIVRLGAAVYGINTAPYRENQMKPVITVRAPVLEIADLQRGDFVGYSATYRATAKRKIAVISIGYADGIPCSLANRGKVFFRKNEKIYEARIIGRISMDNIICDISDIDDIHIGDMADIISDYYTLDDIARDAGTISYEILSRIGNGTRYTRKITNPSDI